MKKLYVTDDILSPKFGICSNLPICFKKFSFHIVLVVPRAHFLYYGKYSCLYTYDGLSQPLYLIDSNIFQSFFLILKNMKLNLIHLSIVLKAD